MEVKLGTKFVNFPSQELQQLSTCNHLINDIPALRAQLHNDGYLFIKNLHNRDEVLTARKHILQYIHSTGEDKIEDITAGTLNAQCGLGCIPFMEGKLQITHAQAVLKVLEGQRPFNFFRNLFDTEVVTFDYKWLRAMHKDGFTGAHVDNVYMSRGTQNVLTMWTPFSDITPTIGTLAICEGSNHIEGFKKFQNTYGELDVEASNLKGTGWFTENPWEISSQFGGVWKTSSFEAGDALIFTLRTVHMSTVNLTNIARISCDTRWQPTHERRDKRYFGKATESEKSPQFGVWATQTIPQNTTSVLNSMGELKKSWGFGYT